ncbi:LytTr DNA-binding domain protein [Glycocaulis albus]|uniref:LytTr DNA-binding domain protein n=1 Tax=Glycocaulis albus TaxID=1382801 RepID=A0ABQ1XC48_9PROT|nr:LytTR family DNA-binding domain-containing protein [Glycocaulis albus]GGG89986.1 LytTr DNA-binding domain protein [Glycocaulis albus]
MLPVSENAQTVLRRWSVRAVWIVAIGTFLAILGPYGTGQVGWPRVWVYWVGLIALGAVVGWTAGPLAQRLFPGLPDWAHYAVAGFCISVPVTAAVFTINILMQGRVVWSALPVTWFFVLVICAFVTGIAWLADHMQLLRAAAHSAADTAATASAALTDKLPHRLRRARLIAMSAEDHYLRVRTDAGEALILMRLSDAVAACSALNGAQVHRSWWVARDAVADARKGDGRGTLILEDGSEVPVSRSYYPALREAGWF